MFTSSLWKPLAIGALIFSVFFTGTAHAQVTVVSAANYAGGTAAPEEIVSGFGTGLATTTQGATGVPLPTTLGGTTVKVRDSAGTERLSPLFYVSSTQINFQIPLGTALGSATITVTSGAVTRTGTVTIANVAPGFFTADATGKGLAAAQALRLRADNSSSVEEVARYDSSQSKFVSLPVNLNTTDQMFLQLYGTGVRRRSNLSNVTATIGGVAVSVLYAGSQNGYEGLDQINLTLPRNLPGGELDVVVKVDGVAANIVKLAITPVASAESTTYLATMRPENGVSSPGSGSSVLRLSADEKTATVTFNYGNLTTPVTSAHIHGPADPGQSGNVLFDLDDAPKLADGSMVWTIAQVGTVTPAQIVQALKAGRLYINIHSSKYPSGEIRGHYGLINGTQTFTPPAAPPALPGGNPTASDAARFLTQATFGPKMTDITALQTKGFEAWFNEQFAMSAESHLSYIDWLKQSEPNKQFYDEAMMETFWKQTVLGNDQLRQRVSYALSQIFVVSFNSDLSGEHYAVASYADMLNKNAFGNFRQLLEDVTLHPAMGRFLDHIQNDKEDPVTGRNPNENYAREVLQLFSIGLYKLHPDGTLMLDAKGLPTETYDQEVVKGFAHVFTGWSYGSFTKTENNWKWPPIWNNGSQFWRVPMELWPNHHSTSSKTILNGVTLPANQTAQKDLQDALDNIFNHPNVGPFISRQLIQRLVTSNPSPGYIYRVAQKFNNNGNGVRGDMKAVIKAVLLDYEARSTTAFANQGYGKLREPIVRMAQLLRAFNYSCPCGKIPLYWMDSPIYALGQNPYRAPTVFNFFEPGYTQPGPIAAAGLVAPEFQITSEVSITGISNFMRYVIFTGFKWDTTKPLTPDFSNLTPMAANPTQLVDHLNLLLMSGQMSTTLKNSLVSELTKMSSDPVERVKEAAHCIMTSPEYVIQK
ncbi:MAG: DUF1800 family protein [Blastocatellia bacterium]|nr:DUF1800 family protein [Blastocatellia bacterium]